MSLFWAYLAGVLTLINPCVLPLLPITLAAALQSSRLGPLALAAGLTVTFAVVGLTVTAFGPLLGLDDRTVARVAAALMVGFGLLLLLPRGQLLLARLASPLADRANQGIARVAGDGLGAQFLVGALLGAVWSPCIGPTLGGAIGLAASGDGLPEAGATMLVFGLGVSSVLVALAYGSREVLGARRARMQRWMPWAKPLLGATLAVVGVAMLLGVDKRIEVWLLDVLPVWLQDLSVAI
ncbi:MAG: cytochrome c biogenesis protein CcdA [Ectothiorhodospiraceae bacterium]|nr:cytochrome c biogenesis protein CcdA [Ectothiorhodospiraceae bacterium]